MTKRTKGRRRLCPRDTSRPELVGGWVMSRSGTTRLSHVTGESCVTGTETLDLTRKVKVCYNSWVNSYKISKSSKSTIYYFFTKFMLDKIKSNIVIPNKMFQWKFMITFILIIVYSF